MALTYLLVLVMLSQLTGALAAQTGSLQRRDPERELWLVRSETITEELKKDAADRQGDLNGMRGALNSVPNVLRIVALIAFIDRLGESRNKETDPMLEFLSEARKQLDSSNDTDDKKYPLYFVLLRLTVQYAPAEALEVLRKAIATLNRAEQNQPEQMAPQDSEFLKNVPVSLIEMDEFAMKTGVTSITSRQTRTQLRLALLEASLKKVRMAKRSMSSQ